MYPEPRFSGLPGPGRGWHSTIPSASLASEASWGQDGGPVRPGKSSPGSAPAPGSPPPVGQLCQLQGWHRSCPDCLPGFPRAPCPASACSPPMRPQPDPGVAGLSASLLPLTGLSCSPGGTGHPLLPTCGTYISLELALGPAREASLKSLPHKTIRKEQGRLPSAWALSLPHRYCPGGQEGRGLDRDLLPAAPTPSPGSVPWSRALTPSLGAHLPESPGPFWVPSATLLAGSCLRAVSV